PWFCARPQAWTGGAPPLVRTPPDAPARFDCFLAGGSGWCRRLAAWQLGVELLETATRRKGEAGSLAVSGRDFGGAINPETRSQRSRRGGAVDAAVEDNV